MSRTTENLIEVKGLRKWFPVNSTKLIGGEKLFVKAVNGVDLEIKYGETLGIVGESGCGKSTLGRTMVKLLQATEGQVIFQGTDITRLSNKEMRPFRRNMQIMFQDPYASLNPRFTVADIIAEPMDTMKTYKTRQERLERISELMETCGINKAFMNRYPHEFSGGQRQRIGIARALSVSPKFMVCDEPVSALDVSIQSQIINLLVELQRNFDLTLAFISHDLGVVEYIADRIAVMYLGKIVEIADKTSLFDNPTHPYTKALLKSIPEIGSKKFDDDHPILEGDIPSPVRPPSGCPFHTRCPEVRPDCSTLEPQLKDIGGGHRVSCLLI